MLDRPNEGHRECGGTTKLVKTLRVLRDRLWSSRAMSEGQAAIRQGAQRQTPCPVVFSIDAAGGQRNNRAGLAPRRRPLEASPWRSWRIA